MLQVFFNSAFTRALCGGQWAVQGISGENNAFNELGTSTAKYGCCPANNFMSNPNADPFDTSMACSACPAELASVSTNVENDATSCGRKCLGGSFYDITVGCQSCVAGKYNPLGSETLCKDCPTGTYSTAQQASCDYEISSCPKGNFVVVVDSNMLCSYTLY